MYDNGLELEAARSRNKEEEPSRQTGSENNNDNMWFDLKREGVIESEGLVSYQGEP